MIDNRCGEEDFFHCKDLIVYECCKKHLSFCIIDKKRELGDIGLVNWEAKVYY